ncbi:MAG: DNA polymerase [Bacteroidota bacterium]
MVRWLLVDLNSYFASVEQQLRSELRGKPVAVVPLIADTTFCIAASYEAKAFGVKTGTRVGDAKKMCPGLLLVEARHAKYVEYHTRIVTAVESCVPVAAVLSIDEMACQLTGSQREVEKAVALAAKIKQTIYADVGEMLRCSVGIATNRFLAKVASDMQKPDGLVVITQADLPQKLYPLKTRDFPGIGANMEKRLAQRGIVTAEQLLNLSKPEMKNIWQGIIGERYWYWLRGEDLTETLTRRRTVGHSHVLPPKMRTPTDAFAIAQQLLHKAAARLRRMHYWASHLRVDVKFMNRTSWTDHISFVESQDTLTLLEALQKLWKNLPQGKLLAVGVTLFDLVHDSAHNFSLFSDEVKRTRLSEAMDKLNTKYGGHLLHFGGMHALQAAAPTRIAFTNIPSPEDFDFDE